VYWRLTLGLILATLLVGTHWKAYVVGQQGVRAQWDQDKAQRVALALQAEQAARAREQELQAAKPTSRGAICPTQENRVGFCRCWCSV